MDVKEVVKSVLKPRISSRSEGWDGGYNKAVSHCREDLERSIRRGDLVPKEEVDDLREDVKALEQGNFEATRLAFERGQKILQLESELHRYTHGEAAPLAMIQQRQRISELEKEVERLEMLEHDFKEQYEELQSKLSSSIPREALLTEKECLKLVNGFNFMAKGHGQDDGYDVGVKLSGWSKQELSKALVQAQKKKIEETR